MSGGQANGSDGLVGVTASYSLTFLIGSPARVRLPYPIDPQAWEHHNYVKKWGATIGWPMLVSESKRGIAFVATMFLSVWALGGSGPSGVSDALILFLISCPLADYKDLFWTTASWKRRDEDIRPRKGPEDGYPGHLRGSAVELPRVRVREAKARGLGEDEVYFEAFGADTSGDPSEVEVTSARGTKKSSSEVLKVGEEETLLEVLKKHFADEDVPSSCAVGNCGTWKVVLRSGRVDYRGMTQMEEERKDAMLSCVNSNPTNPLTKI
ncbi:uncharacterized protein F4812DRAFT_461077 [Daldinia caldariorum]|uniref:uncharacterized protein n=1 Tax=Daldinia caldariorum TaxID=326644 RepID=UPI002007730B|nr:uncharacterized protein F4812DRAFT_461077 [Daldinia caldariorum]KAI1466103.1 hypothetical protein F4812DRAFT_461077 [Daldinia caldariorum]